MVVDAIALFATLSSLQQIDNNRLLHSLFLFMAIATETQLKIERKSKMLIVSRYVCVEFVDRLVCEWGE